eukprot:m.212113 g.212113  ORF g.212113 m.212113 type:complete len:865 (-) comp19558_c0_seq1:232-2826(-)
MDNNSKRLSIKDAKDVVISMITDPSMPSRVWQVGDFCLAPDKNGLLHNACIEAVNESQGVVRVRIEDPESHTDSVAEVAVNSLRHRPSSAPLRLWHNDDVVMWLHDEEMHDAATIFVKHKVDGHKLLSLDEAELKRMGCSRQLTEKILQARHRLKASKSEGSIRETPAPSYLPPPAFDSDVRGPVQRAAPNRESGPARGSSRLNLSRSNSRFSRSKTLTRSELDRRRRRKMLETGDIPLDDLSPTDNPDISEAADDVQAHLEIMNGLKRQKTRMFQKLKELREEKRIVEQQKLHMSELDQLKFDVRMRYNKFYMRVADFFKQFRLWAISLKDIESRFGTSVASYFELIRWFFLLNVFYSVLWVFFVVIPQSTEPQPDVPTALTAEELALQHPLSVWEEILTSSGSWEDTLMFYGYYMDGTLGHYSIPGAYLIIVFLCLSGTLLFIVHSLARAYNKQAMYHAELSRGVFAEHILTKWDHTVYDKGTIEAYHLANSRLMKKMILDAISARKPTAPIQDAMIFCFSFKKSSWNIFLFRLFMWLTWGVLTIVSVVVIYLSAARIEPEPRISVYKSLTAPFVLTLVNFVVPALLVRMAPLELYGTASTEFLVSFCRNVVSRITFFLTFLITFLRRHNFTTNACWEDRLGQAMYQLLLFDFIFAVFGPLLIYGVRRLLVAFGTVSSMLEFNVAENVLEQISRECFIWIGMFHCPFLPFIGAMMGVVLFFFKKTVLIKICAPPKRDFHFTSISSFKKLALVMFLLCLFPIGYFIVFRNTSFCGPFRSYEFAYSLVSDTVDKFPTAISNPIKFIGTPGFALPLIGLLLALAHNFYYHWRGKQAVIKELNYILNWQRMDTRHLLRLIQKLEGE